MFFTIHTAGATPIYEQIVSQVRRAVEAGDLGPGDGLPSVRSLAADLEINPNTVAKAYLLLERDGLVESRRRRGCFISQDAPRLARQKADGQIEALVERVALEGESLGLSRSDLLRRLQRRLEEREDER